MTGLRALKRAAEETPSEEGGNPFELHWAGRGGVAEGVSKKFREAGKIQTSLRGVRRESLVTTLPLIVLADFTNHRRVKNFIGFCKQFKRRR